MGASGRQRALRAVGVATLLVGAPLAAQTVRAVPATPEQLQLSYAPVVRRAAPAVVNIYTAKRVATPPRSMAELFAQQYGGKAPPQRVVQSLGSGVIVDAGGMIVTNNHVVAGADQILVALADRREFPAKIVFADARTDLAVLRVDTAGTALPVVELADSDRAQVGDIVLAIGDPFGFGQTVTHGIVSALARNSIGVSDRQFFLQTDAAINPGNSGGALLDMTGKLIGINTALFSQTGNSVGIGFAIPSNMVRVFLNAATSGKLVTGWIGAEGEGLTVATARAAGLDRPRGVLVTAVANASPAAAAGIRPGDILMEIDGKEVADAGMLRYRIATLGVGDTVNVSLRRGDRALSVPLRLAAPPETPPRQLTPIRSGAILLGTTIANLSPAYAQELGLGLPERGVVIVSIARGAPALQLKLRPGDIVEAVNGVAVRSVDEVVAAATRPATALRYNRGGAVTECVVQPNRAYSCRAG